MADIPLKILALNGHAAPAKLWGSNMSPRYGFGSNRPFRDLWVNFEITWDAWLKPQIDMMIAVGGNCYKPIGDTTAVFAGDITISQYLANWTVLLNYCQARSIYVQPALVHNGFRSDTTSGVIPIGSATTPGTIISTLTQLAALLATYSNVIGIDLVDEPTTVFSSTANAALTGTEAGQIYTAVKAIAGWPTGANAIPCWYSDPVSVNATPGQSWPADPATSTWATYWAYCVCYDPHSYTTLNSTDYSNLDTHYYTNHPSKPMLLTEFGDDLADGPTNRTARVVANMGLVLAKSYVHGGLVWSTCDYDSVTTNQYGLFDESFNPHLDLVIPFIQSRGVNPTTTNFEDNFTGTTGTALAAHVPTSIASSTPNSAYSWTGQVAGFTLDGSEHVVGSGTAYASTTPANATLQVSILPTSDPGDFSWVAVLFRSDGTGIGGTFNALRIFYESGYVVFDVERWVAGSLTWRASSDDIGVPKLAYTAATTYNAQLIYNGATMAIYTSIGSGTAFSSTPDYPAYTDPAPLTSGSVGISGGLTAEGGTTSGTKFCSIKVFSTGAPTPPTPTVVAGEPGLCLGWADTPTSDFIDYHLYKDGSICYAGPAAFYADPRAAAGVTHSYQVSIVGSSIGETALSSVLNAAAGVYPATGDVRLTTIYGPTNNLSGTLAVPTPSQVLAGVAVDATTGNVIEPTTSQVQAGVPFGASGGSTGSYAGPAATAYTVVGLPSTPIVGETYSVYVLLNNPASASGYVTFGAQAGVTWGGTAVVARYGLSGSTTATFTTAGTLTPTVSHAGLGFTGDPTLTQVTVENAESGEGGGSSGVTLEQLQTALASGIVTLAPAYASCAMPVGTVVAGSNGSAVVVSGLAAGKSFLGQHLYHQASGESREIESTPTYAGGNYTFTFVGATGTATAPFSAVATGDYIFPTT